MSTASQSPHLGARCTMMARRVDLAATSAGTQSQRKGKMQPSAEKGWGSIRVALVVGSAMNGTDANGPPEESSVGIIQPKPHFVGLHGCLLSVCDVVNPRFSENRVPSPHHQDAVSPNSTPIHLQRVPGSTTHVRTRELWRCPRWFANNSTRWRRRTLR